MTDLHTQACPLCSNLSGFEIVSAGAEQRKFFSCDICSEFLISSDAEEWLSSQPRKCEELSSLATFMFADLVLHIFMESDGETRALLAIPDEKANWVPSTA
jgi:hypothetical protein